MNEPTAKPPRRGARTFRAACLVLASVAAAQAAATAWSSKTMQAADEAPPVRKKPERPPADPFLAAVGEADPYPEMRLPAGDPPPNDPAQVLMRPEPLVSVPRAVAAPLDVPITDEEVLTSLDEALHLRSQGDMQGALTRLRAALNKLPDHPRLLYQTARTMDAMGLTQKADPLWKALRKLGKGAGDFSTLAQDRMSDGPQTTNDEEEEKVSVELFSPNRGYSGLTRDICFFRMLYMFMRIEPRHGDKGGGGDDNCGCSIDKFFF